MQCLIKVEDKNIGVETNSVNARDLHSFIHSKQDYSNWIKNRIEKYGFLENQDYIVIETKTAGRPLKEYYITLDMAKELCMVENNDKGREARRYFIQIEKQYKQLQPTNLPQDNLKQIAELQNNLLALTNQYNDMMMANNQHNSTNNANLRQMIEKLISQTEEELKRDTKDRDNFYIQRTKYFLEYIKAMRLGGSELQQFTISTLDIYADKTTKAQNELENIKQKYHRFSKNIDTLLAKLDDVKIDIVDIKQVM